MGAFHPKLHLQLLGGFRLGDAKGKEIRLSGKKAQALLAYLALSPGREHPRETLATLLWGERMDVQARQSLRQALSAIRKALGKKGDVLHAEGDVVSVGGDALKVDALDFAQLTESDSPQDWESATELYTGPLLEKLRADAEDFDDWLAGERGRLHALACATLERLAGHQEQAGDKEGAAKTAARLLTLDPAGEEGHRLLMRLHAATGHRADALRQYQACVEALRRELDAEPSAETTWLYEEIRTGKEHSSTGLMPKRGSFNLEAIIGNEPLALPNRPSIAVLPFQNMSNDPEQEHFGDGLAEDITTALSAYRWLFVIARNSTFTYKGRAVDTKQIGRELGVRYLLEGSLRKEGDRIRITAQLINATTGNQVWAERYDRNVKDVFEVQDELTQTIIAAIEPEVEAAEQVRAKRKPPESLDAWEAFQIGLSLSYQVNKKANVKARKFMKQAINLDPEFAAAYSGLAYTFLEEAVWESLDIAATEGNLRQGTEAAIKSIALDNNDAFGHVILGRLYAFKGEYASAMAELERALNLNPNSASCYSSLAIVETFFGVAEEGIHYAEKALRLSPRDPMRWLSMNGLAVALMRLKRFDEALEWTQRTIQENPVGFWHYSHALVCLVQLDRMDAVPQALSELLRIEPKVTITFVKKFVKNMYSSDPIFYELYIEALRKSGLSE